MREREQEWEITNPTMIRKVFRKRLGKKLGKCRYCPWHGGENTEAWRDRIKKSWKWKRFSKWVNIPTI